MRYHAIKIVPDNKPLIDIIMPDLDQTEYPNDWVLVSENGAMPVLLSDYGLGSRFGHVGVSYTEPIQLINDLN